MNKAELIKALRTATQAGMADCIKALAECHDDLDAAQKWLREKGIARASKKASAIAYEGVVKAGVVDQKGLIIEVNAQTDFTAKNEQFLKLVDEIYTDISKRLNHNEVIDPEQYVFKGQPLKNAGFDLTAVTGEKIAFRRGQMVVNNGTQTIGSYTHSNNKIAALVVFKGKVSAELAKDIAMHVAAMSPKALDESHIDPKWLASEKEILHHQFLEELSILKDDKARAEKEKRAQQIVDGKVKKLMKEICLVHQPFVKDNSITVAQHVQANNGELVYMLRYELGEGIERKESNFADEVAAQMGK